MQMNDLKADEGLTIAGKTYASRLLVGSGKYKDLDEMAPCASPKIIAVKDPCACHDSCCAPPCVYIKICVPCGCEVVTCSKNGDRIRYDYGKYAVDVRVKKGYIEVDYQD